MMTLKLGSEVFCVKYASEATVRSGIINRIVELEQKEGTERIMGTLSLLPELILVGIQKNHRDEYGYNYETGEGKEDKISRIYGLLDDAVDDDEINVKDLFADLQNELQTNGFLASLLQEGQKVSKKKSKNLQVVES